MQVRVALTMLVKVFKVFYAIMLGEAFQRLIFRACSAPRPPRLTTSAISWETTRLARVKIRRVALVLLLRHMDSCLAAGPTAASILPVQLVRSLQPLTIPAKLRGPILTAATKLTASCLNRAPFQLSLSPEAP